MTDKVLVDLGVACSGAQHPKWWATNWAHLLEEMQYEKVLINRIFAISSALPDFNKTESVGEYASEEYKRRNQLTDANRLVVAKNFMDSPSEWLFWIDDDTIIPQRALSTLLKAQKPAIGGLYFNSNPPNNPIAYMLAEDGVGYNPLWDWPPGAIMPVDSIGFGCTLVNKSVFETIRDEHEVFMRPNGSLFPMHRSQLYSDTTPTHFANRPDEWYANGFVYTKTSKMKENDNRLWPFFALEYGRTEDHYFWEMARKCGIRPWVDTSVKCGHIKPATVDYENYKRSKNEKEGLL